MVEKVRLILAYKVTRIEPKILIYWEARTIIILGTGVVCNKPGSVETAAKETRSLV